MLATLGALTDGSIRNSPSQTATEVCGFAPVFLFLASLPARAAAPRRQRQPIRFFLPHLVAIQALCWLNYIGKATRRFASGSLVGPPAGWGGHGSLGAAQLQQAAKATPETRPPAAGITTTVCSREPALPPAVYQRNQDACFLFPNAKGSNRQKKKNQGWFKLNTGIRD